MRLPAPDIWLRGLLAAVLVGTAGAWNGPTVWVLTIVSAVTFFDLGRRDQNERDTVSGTLGDFYGPAMQVAFLLLLAVAAYDNRGPELRWRSPGLYGVAGGIVIFAGARLRAKAAAALGRHFTVALSLLDDHELIGSGPYRWLRHPNYAGILLIAFGTAIMVRSPLATGVALTIWLPLALLRIRKEERVLHGRLGKRWTEYARERWSLLPGVY